MIRAIYVLVVLLASTSLYAQKKKQFSENPSEFYSDFSAFVKNSKNANLAQSFEEFTVLWDGGSFSSTSEDQIIATVNTMLKGNYIANPDFNLYLKATNSFFSNEIGDDDYVEFNRLVDTLVRIKTSKANVKKMFGFFTDLNSKKILSGKRGKTWKVSDASYSIGMKKSPYVSLENIDIALGGNKDTMRVLNTSGRYYFLKSKWWGTEGEVNWERVGLSAADVYAELKHYRIDMISNGYKADSVVFRNLDAYAEPIDGKLADQLDAGGENGSFPTFRSYKKKFTLDDLDEYLIYKGGFGMEGRRIVGTGEGYSPAVMHVLKDNKKFMTLRSNSFFIEPQKVTANATSVTVFLKGDSIFHPNLNLKIERENRYVRLSTSPQNAVQSPFSNSYHNLDMYADQLDCYLDSTYFDIRSARDPDGRASFESINYFSRKRFDQVRGNMSYNPIFKFNELFTLYQKRTYSEDELIGFFGVDKIEQIQPLLLIMTNQGYILYEPSIKEVVLKDKLFTYINAYLKKIDHDVIQLNSIIKERPNSRLQLENYNLEVRGIKTVKLSDSQSVQIYPAKQTIVFKKDRDMEFDGYMKAGRFEYFGKGFSFSYTDFEISMKQIDSMMFNFPDKEHGGVIRRVNTVIQDITGSLKIDKPENKSGRLKAPNYPIFDCFQGAYVYYDYKTVFGGVYDRDRFYFKLKPFVVDSMDNFSMDGMNLLGTFVSAKILPDFDYKLNLQPDFSLGFSTETPPDGYPLYNGTGHCNMKIFLSNSGLRGNGKFTYNGAEIASEEMIFFPDSMQGQKTVFAMTDLERKKFPEVKSENCKLSWTPYSDTMIIAAVDSTAFINMYEPESFLKGELVFTKKEMYGRGEFNYRQSLAQSAYFNFKHRDLAADSTQLEILDIPMERVALSNESVRVKIDFDKQILKGETNYDTVSTLLPINQYSTNIPYFKWDVQEEKVFLTKGDETEDIDFFFVSTNPVFDSLTFAPSSAELDLSSFEINAFDIKYFLVADSRIKPADEVQIAENGEIPSLEDAEITASADNEYHKVIKANVNIFSSKKFTATGLYQYIDPNEKAWEITMTEIRTTEEGLTRGVGVIPDSMNFHFGSNIGYNGNMIFLSNRKEIEFNGEVEFEHKKVTELATQKLKFEGLVAFDSLYFNITEAKNIFGQELHTGIFLNTKTLRLYSIFLGTKQTPDDLELFRAEGDLYLDTDSNMYVITAFDRYYNEDLRPSRWIFDMDTNQVYMDGPLNMGYSIENFDFSLSGYLTYDIAKEETKVKMAGGINFPFQESAVKVLSDSVINFAYFNDDVNNLHEYIASGIGRQTESQRDAEKVINSLYSSGNVPKMKNYQPAIHFAQTELVWDTTYRSFRNLEQIGMANFGSYSVNKNINGRVDFFQTGDRDSVSLYFEGNAGNWYLFTFVEEEFYIASSDQEFLKRALGKKPKDIIGKLNYDAATEEMISATQLKAIRKLEED